MAAKRINLAVKRSVPFGTLAIVVVVVVIHALPAAESVLQYDRLHIEQGEYWRLFTCHWCHASAPHLFWNTMLVVIAGGILERQSGPEFRRTLVLSILALGPLLYAFLPEMATYVGLSGLAAGLVAAVTTKGLMQRDRDVWIWVTIAFLMGGKIIYESFDPRLLLANSTSHRSVPLAHLVGIIAGLTATVRISGKQWLRPARPPRRLCEHPVPHPD
ncbi:MAG: rhombosortase [Limisphaerales bacterium]